MISSPVGGQQTQGLALVFQSFHSIKPAERGEMEVIVVTATTGKDWFRVVTLAPLCGESRSLFLMSELGGVSAGYC
jgi:hypothetical protein